MGFSFTQPIEMRFNELIAGVRSDVAVSVFGDDLDVLERLGGEMARVLRRRARAPPTSGPSRCRGCRCCASSLDHARAARYGIPVDDVLGAVEAIRAGRVVGVVMDGVRRYDIVVKFASRSRRDLEAIRNLPVMDPDGHPVPLAQLAEIRIEEGPAQISREFGQRRLNVEANVRGRDLESFVREARERDRASRSTSPRATTSSGAARSSSSSGDASGCSSSFRSRSFAIFVLLYGAFGSVRSAALDLHRRSAGRGRRGRSRCGCAGIPFSISAGVGFIALFGVAVLERSGDGLGDPSARGRGSRSRRKRLRTARRSGSVPS